MIRAVVLILAAALSSLVGAHAMADALEMKRYRNEPWKFELDIPARWTVTPPAADNGMLVRFMSIENGHHLVTISRHLMRPAQTPQDVVDQNQKDFTAKGYSSFVRGEALIGRIRAPTLDYQIVGANGSTTYWRHYYVIQGPIGYQLAFGTTNRDDMFGLYDRMAKSFVFEDL